LCLFGKPSFSIAGVISYSTREVTDVISSNVNNVHVVVRDSNDATPRLADDIIYADIPAYANIKVSVTMKTVF